MLLFFFMLLVLVTGGDFNIGVLVVDNDYSNVLHLTAICPVQWPHGQVEPILSLFGKKMEPGPGQGSPKKYCVRCWRKNKQLHKNDQKFDTISPCNNKNGTISQTGGAVFSIPLLQLYCPKNWQTNWGVFQIFRLFCCLNESGPECNSLHIQREMNIE